MAAVVGHSSFGEKASLMHPFFKPALSRNNSSQAESLKKEPEEFAQLAGTLNRRQNGLQKDESFPNGSQNGPTPDKQKNDQDGDYEDTKYIDIDPNLERRKRRKTTPSANNGTIKTRIGVQTHVEGEASETQSWFAQLQEAASAGSPDTERHEDTDMTVVESPQTPIADSSVKLAIRKSPIKTPRSHLLAVDAPRATPPDVSRPNTQNASSVGKPLSSSKASETPKKKVLKLTSKGKLLSSPPSVSPASKYKGRSKTTKGPSKIASETHTVTALRYGTDVDSRKRIGSQIDTILSQKVSTKNHAPPKVLKTTKVTHPFFLGKAARWGRADAIDIEDGSITGHDSDVEEKGNNPVIKPVAWKDLTFKSNKVSATKVLANAVHPLWPPKDMQHLKLTSILPELQHNAQSTVARRGASKSKAEVCSVLDTEDILRNYAATLQYHRGRVPDIFPLPEKVVLSGHDALKNVEDVLASSMDPSSPRSNVLKDAYPMAFEHIRNRILSGPASYQNEVAGTAQSWLLNSAPWQAGQVLQAQSSTLREWLVKHQVNHAATKLSAQQKAKPVQKRRSKKKAGDLDDFIAPSDEEDEEGTGITKNALIITGPHGCGKTASVYAVAKELDFEVFEIHPGMRRTAKDIFDKVGDMTQNHLVMKATQFDGEIESPPVATLEQSSGERVRDSENAMQSFLRGKKQTTKKGRSPQVRPGTPPSDVGRKSENRKQSLILFEEVDILFEEDKGFWTGVLQLVEQSKRPVILTCNDPTTIPTEDLPIFATLDYTTVPTEVVVAYVLMLAAAEGHQLDCEAIRSLYLSKDKDLRATISELNFWCQMAIGSEKGGLDWIIDRQTADGASTATREKLRMFSKDSYRNGMGLVPQTLFMQNASNQGVLLQYAQEELGIPLQRWQHDQDSTYDYHLTIPDQLADSSTFEYLKQCQVLAEARSVADLFEKPVDSETDASRRKHDALSAELGGRILAALKPPASPLCVPDIVSTYLKTKTTPSQLTPGAITAAFEPLMVEKPVFPASRGRLAPSLDGSSFTVITDIAPYVRSIALYDQRLAEQREMLAGGPQNTKMRRTRAARAAQEGGNIKSTRDEKWFPKATDYAALFQTGGSWPQWVNELGTPASDESARGSESRTESEATSPTDDTEMADGY